MQKETDYREARENMVICQLETNNVSSDAILDAFRTVPRQRYVPEEYQSKVYVDEDIKLKDGKVLLEPLILARMLEVADIQMNDIVLNVGDACGYSAAILSELSSTVVCLEVNSGNLAAAKNIWDEKDCCNVTISKGNFTNGCKDYAPYSLIVINGAVESIPETLLEQLDEEGRLVAVIRDQAEKTGKITVFRKGKGGNISKAEFFDAATPFITEAKPVKSFTF